LKKTPDAGIVAGEQVFVERVSLIMRKDNKEFMDKINQALADLTKDGTLATISDKYFKTDITCR
jgi:cystine transport system substrate-binding protein